jgi:hypothetical protein
MSLFFFSKRINIPDDITSYDVLKCVTVIFMLIDHLGAFFLPDYSWLRVVGRLGFPAWFFLAGYSKGQVINPSIVFGACLLILGNIAFGQYIFPANALVTFICIRICLRPTYSLIFSNWEYLLYTVMAMIFISLPFEAAFEYGTLAFLFALFGYAVRNKDSLGISEPCRKMFCAFVSLSIPLIQSYLFQFTKEQTIVCVVEMCMASYIMFHFKDVTFQNITHQLPNAVSMLLRFGGRYTMEIYVIHLLLIKAYLLAGHYGHYQWFSPTWTPHMLN